ncbi:integrin alpha-PS1 isoform X2 [Neocloeon triangulifer]|uniref:integrin alpha-PS1 isoform X2 n=1 Tax=Neocloeon triangulifer TaxID=2078957 RepID=UPI00286FAE5E|nr:integrin alpha-PS1 isoform X2 [Neocloeon triangulifer]
MRMSRVNMVWRVVMCTVVLLAGQVRAFNLETRLPLVKNGADGVYFGFSVAEHQIVDSVTNNSLVTDSWMLVGAPLDQNLQPNTNRSGALWKCPMTTLTDDCVQVITDGLRNIDSQRLQSPGNDEIKDGQWMGVTVRSQGRGGKVLVCAHRYIHKGLDFQWGRGLCYTLTQYLDFDKSHDPCKGRSTKRAHEDYGFCQAGTSGVLTESEELLAIGTPGPFTWRGAIFVSSVSDDFLNRPKTTFHTPVTETDSPVDKYAYLGMSVAAGNFYSKKIGFAAGAPRDNGTGRVVIVPEVRDGVNPMQIHAQLSGEQFASSFGYELAAADINGDKRSDLLVGAPFYYGRDSGGAVYVYMNTNEYCLHCNKPQKLVGKPESRFGFSIARLGDLNKDGFEDVAIGAPYEGKGAVYIYLGSDKGLITEPAQVIRSEALPRSQPPTFGYSLSGGTDMDLNGYPDLLIGAYDSDTTVLLMARPIIGILTYVRPEQNLKNIDPLKKGCSKYPNRDYTCFVFEACFDIESAGRSYGGKHDLTLKYRLEAETFSGRKFSRVWFGTDEDDNNRPSFVEKNMKWMPQKGLTCSEEVVSVKENTRDIQSPIIFKLSYSLIQEEPQPIITGEALPLVDRYPILNQQEAVKVFQATFQKDCGDNEVCESNLEVQAELQLKQVGRQQWELLLGELEEVVVNVTIYNHGESAYESQLFLSHPAGLSYIGTGIEEKNQFACKPFNTTMVSCSMGNPFKKGTKHLRLRFDPKDLSDRDLQLLFVVSANSTSEDIGQQGPLIMQANVVKKAELSIKGLARPEQVFYGGTVKGESAIRYRDEVGTRVLHTYQVFNSGPWKVNQLEVHIDWPYQVANNKPQGKWLLYMDEKPTVESIGGGECRMSYGQVNPLNLTSRPGMEDPMDSLILDSPPERILFDSTRRKRDTEMVLRPEAITDKEGRRRSVISSNCVAGTAKCFTFVCIIRNLHKNTEATIRIRARLWNSTLVEDYPRVDWVKIGSRARIHLQGIHQSNDDDEFQVETIAYPELLEQTAGEGVPLWMIIVAIAAGLLLLILLTICLWKCGFFKRRRPDPTLSGNLEKQRHD